MGRFLVTGGAGYIGSHTAKLLAKNGDEMHGLRQPLARPPRPREMGPSGRGRPPRPRPPARGDALVQARMPSSISPPSPMWASPSPIPASTTTTMPAARCRSSRRCARRRSRKLIVSSTCATYGQPDRMPITEDTPQRPMNPYGQSKLMMERLCRDFEAAHGIRSVALRYFNACGCDIDGEIGERHDPEPHLIPRALMAAAGEIGALQMSSAATIPQPTAPASATISTSTISPPPMCRRALSDRRRRVRRGQSRHRPRRQRPRSSRAAERASPGAPCRTACRRAAPAIPPNSWRPLARRAKCSAGRPAIPISTRSFPLPGTGM